MCKCIHVHIDVHISCTSTRLPLPVIVHVHACIDVCISMYIRCGPCTSTRLRGWPSSCRWRPSPQWPFARRRLTSWRRHACIHPCIHARACARTHTHRFRQGREQPLWQAQGHFATALAYARICGFAFPTVPLAQFPAACHKGSAHEQRLFMHLLVLLSAAACLHACTRARRGPACSWPRNAVLPCSVFACYYWPAQLLLLPKPPHTKYLLAITT